MKKILAILAIAAAAASATKFEVVACPISQHAGSPACALYKVDRTPHVEPGSITIYLGDGKLVILNTAGWSVLIRN